MENKNLENIKGKKVLIVGMGKSGIAAVQAMLALGAEVSIQDAKERNAVDGQLLNFWKANRFAVTSMRFRWQKKSSIC